MVNRVFTDSAIKTLRRMARQGAHAPDIARRLGFSRQSIAKKARRPGIKITPTPVPTRTPDEVAEIVRLHRAGLGCGRISKQTGHSVDVVRRTISKMRRALVVVVGDLQPAPAVEPPARIDYGAEPLPAFHPISWGAITADMFAVAA